MLWLDRNEIKHIPVRQTVSMLTDRQIERYMKVVLACCARI